MTSFEILCTVAIVLGVLFPVFFAMEIAELAIPCNIIHIILTIVAIERVLSNTQLQSESSIQYLILCAFLAIFELAVWIWAITSY